MIFYLSNPSFFFSYFHRYAPRWDCGSVYEICVELLNRRKKAVKFFQPEPVTFPQWNDQHWEQVIPIFWSHVKLQELVTHLVCLEWVVRNAVTEQWTVLMLGLTFYFYMLQISKETLHFIAIYYYLYQMWKTNCLCIYKICKFCSSRDCKVVSDWSARSLHFRNLTQAQTDTVKPITLLTVNNCFYLSLGSWSLQLW